MTLTALEQPNTHAIWLQVVDEARRLVHSPRTTKTRAQIIEENIVPHRDQALVVDGFEILDIQDIADSMRDRMEIPAQLTLPVIIHAHFTFPKDPYCLGHFPDRAIVPGHWKQEFGLVAGNCLIGMIPSFRGMTALVGDTHMAKGNALPPDTEVRTYVWMNELQINGTIDNFTASGIAQAYLYAGSTKLGKLTFDFNLMRSERLAELMETQTNRIKGLKGRRETSRSGQ